MHKLHPQLHPIPASPSPVCPANTVSWCKCEAVINSMNAIAVATEQAPPPPLVVMSLSLKITLNPKTGTNEVGLTKEVGVACIELLIRSLS